MQRNQLKVDNWLQCVTWNSDSARENHREHTAGHTDRRALSEEFNRDRKQAKVCSVGFLKLIIIISATQTVDSLDAQELKERFLNIALDYQTLHLQDASPKTTGEGAWDGTFHPDKAGIRQCLRAKGHSLTRTRTSLSLPFTSIHGSILVLSLPSHCYPEGWLITAELYFTAKHTRKAWNAVWKAFYHKG